MTRTLAATVLVLALVTPKPARAIFGVADTGDGILASILVQNIQQVANTSAQIIQLQDALTTARETLEVSRSVYAAVGTFTNFDPQRFLNEAKAQFLAQNTVLGASNAFVNDVARNGLRRGDPTPIIQRVRTANLYNDGRIQPGYHAYDTRTAMSLGADVDGLLADPRTRRSLAEAPTVGSSISGVITNDLAANDPIYFQAVMQQRAVARDNATKAMQVYAESLGASPGKAQQLAAQAASLTAAGVGQLSETATRQLSLQELDRAERSEAAAQQRQEHDALWKGIDKSLDGFRPVPVPEGSRR